MNDWSIETLRMQKRSRFQMILEWEQKRASDSLKHKGILSLLGSRIMQKATNSRDANRAIIKFLHEKSQGFKQYSEILLSELTYLPDPPNKLESDSEAHTPCISSEKGNIDKSKDSSLRAGLSSVSNYQNSLSKKFVQGSSTIQ